MLLPLRSRFTSPPTLKKTRKITFQNLFPTEQTLRNEHSFSLKKNIYKISKIPSKSSNEMVTKLSLSLKYNLNRFDPRKSAERSKERKKNSANKIPKRDDFLVSDRGNVQSNSKFPNNLLNEGLEGNFLLEIIIRIVSGGRRKAYVRRR